MTNEENASSKAAYKYDLPISGQVFLRHFCIFSRHFFARSLGQITSAS